MERCDVLVVGGGPAGSSCALELSRRGLDVVVLDRKDFPRDKICAGWITPQVLAELQVDPDEYARGRVLQPIRGFQVSRQGDPVARACYDEVVSYGIRRCELDEFLLRRSGARLRLGVPLGKLERADDGDRGGDWLVGDSLRARVVVGAGGHFCPLAREFGARPGQGEPAVLAREIEFEMSAEQQAACPARGELPELYFTRDLRGYGWVVRKGDWLNVGIGRQDPLGLPGHVERFLDWLIESGRVPADMPRQLKGHAYLLYEDATRKLSGDGFALVGDAAGLAYGRSGEGIRPAVETGLLAGREIHSALSKRGRFDTEGARRYADAVSERLGVREAQKARGLTDWIPAGWRGPVAGRVLGMPWFARNVVVDRWFLHRHEAPLEVAP